MQIYLVGFVYGDQIYVQRAISGMNASALLPMYYNAMYIIMQINIMGT